MQMCHNQNSAPPQTHTHTHTLSQPAMRDSFKGNWFYPRLISPSLSLELHQQSVNRLAGQAPFVSAKETPQSDHHHSHTHTQHPCRNPAAEFKHSDSEVSDTNTEVLSYTHNHNIQAHYKHCTYTHAHKYRCMYTPSAGEYINACS